MKGTRLRKRDREEEMRRRLNLCFETDDNHNLTVALLCGWLADWQAGWLFVQQDYLMVLPLSLLFEWMASPSQFVRILLFRFAGQECGLRARKAEPANVRESVCP